MTKNDNKDKSLFVLDTNVLIHDPMAEEGGFFSGLKFWGDKPDAVDKSKYQIKLMPRGDDTVIIVLDDNGQPDISKTSYRILSLLHEQLK